ncbi:MAG: hypothetical protein KBG15_17060 [Kofleriaceae bacterium]|nr:hypothetical protein [Kofleriaceae bacterium]
MVVVAVVAVLGVVFVVMIRQGPVPHIVVGPPASNDFSDVSAGFGSARRAATSVNRNASASPSGSVPVTRVAAADSLVRLFDTDALCEHYGAIGCERGRTLAARCEHDDIAACRSLLGMFSNGQFADLAMAKAVAELLCRRGKECERRDQLVRFTKASLNFADHVDARAACRAGDALACATAGLAYGDNIPQRLEWAERACALGVATRGGCIEITLLAPTLKAKVAAVQRACDAGSPPACSLVAAMLTAEASATLSAAQKTQAARALQRCCELAPGADCCNALTPAELPD